MQWNSWDFDLVPLQTSFSFDRHAPYVSTLHCEDSYPSAVFTCVKQGILTKFQVALARSKSNVHTTLPDLKTGLFVILFLGIAID